MTSERKRWLTRFAGIVMAGMLHVSAGEIAKADDDDLRRAAEAAVRTNPYLGVFDRVVVEVRGGQVRLRGSVEQRCRREAAAASVARLSGVSEVRNDIEVQSSTPGDVMLRRRVFERLYYGGGIDRGERPEWPVRILVSDGRVTLSGEAASSADRERVEAMAWGAGARAVENQLQAPTPPLQRAAWD